MQITLFNIYWVFFKIGVVLLGGGYVILPLLIAEVVDKRKWITKEELIEYYSLSQCLPGIIAVNTSVFTGYRLRGKYGAFIAALGMCTSPFFAIICLASVLSTLTNNPIVQNIFWGVGIGIIIMISLTVKEIWSKSIVDWFTLLLFLLIFVLTAFFNVSPVICILGASIVGVCYRLLQRKAGKQ